MEALIAIIAFAVWCATIGLGAYIAAQKGRQPIEGLAFGLLLGPLGLLIEVLLPDGQERASAEQDDPAPNDDHVAGYLGQFAVAGPATAHPGRPSAVDAR